MASTETAETESTSNKDLTNNLADDDDDLKLSDSTYQALMEYLSEQQEREKQNEMAQTGTLDANFDENWVSNILITWIV